MFFKLYLVFQGLESKPSKVEDLPMWNKGDNILVMCDAYNCDMEPMATNQRKECLKIMKKAEAEKPWFGIEQEYTL